MSDSEGQQRFLRELEKDIGNHPDQEDILAEYEVHIYELLQESQVDEAAIYNELINRLGTPQEIAKVWKQETGVTPKKTQWLFVIINIAIFIGGTLLTVMYNYFQWSWVDQIWAGLTEASFLIMLIYTLFWGLLGYEIGREFGHRGYRLLQRTFLISIIPNLLLMYLVVFKVFPYEWFGSILNIRFIVLCIVFTGVLYPVSMVGYRWGKKVSI